MDSVTVRTLRQSDLPILREFADQSGYPYPDPTGTNIETVLVIADEDDYPVMVCAAERIVQLYLWVDPARRAPVKFAALAALHRQMRPLLRRRGYTEANAFLPPGLEKAFGRRLQRTFGWCANWVSYYLRF